MGKSQKIKLVIFSIMFLLPEILWSSIGNFFNAIIQNKNHTIFFRPNFLTTFDNRNILILILLIQFMGIIGLLFNIQKIKFNKIAKFSLLILLVLIGITVVFLTYILFATRNGIGF